MNLKNLLADLEIKGKLKRQAVKTDYLDSLLFAAHRNFMAAEANIGKFEEVAFRSAYDGLLQISRAVLLLNGYRPDDGQQHKTTFMAAEAILGRDFKKLIGRIDIYRMKRNNSIYDPIGIITKTEAENILRTAKEYWEKIKKYLKEKDPQLRLFDL